MRSFALTAVSFLLILWAPAALAHSYSHAEIKIGHVWALPSEGPDAQVFMPLYNSGKQADRLVGAETPRAASVVLRDAGDETIPSLALAPGRPLAMRPGSRALILKDLKAPLETGDQFELTLRFERAGAVEVTVWVEEAPSD